jgi:hypothetical protein
MNPYGRCSVSTNSECEQRFQDGGLYTLPPFHHHTGDAAMVTTQANVLHPLARSLSLAIFPLGGIDRHPTDLPSTAAHNRASAAGLIGLVGTAARGGTNGDVAFSLRLRKILFFLFNHTRIKPIDYGGALF